MWLYNPNSKCVALMARTVTIFLGLVSAHISFLTCPFGLANRHSNALYPQMKAPISTSPLNTNTCGEGRGRKGRGRGGQRREEERAEGRGEEGRRSFSHKPSYFRHNSPFLFGCSSKITGTLSFSYSLLPSVNKNCYRLNPRNTAQLTSSIATSPSKPSSCSPC